MVAIAVRGGKTAVEKITESGHEKAHQIQPQQIALPAAGVAVALNHAEQKQGIAQPSEPVQPYRRSVMNTPGTVGGNWQWRMVPGQLGKEHSDRLSWLVDIFGRF